MTKTWQLEDKKWRLGASSRLEILTVDSVIYCVNSDVSFAPPSSTRLALIFRTSVCVLGNPDGLLVGFIVRRSDFDFVSVERAGGNRH